LQIAFWSAAADIQYELQQTLYRNQTLVHGQVMDHRVRLRSVLEGQHALLSISRSLVSA
jgi:hypothetical protein